MSSPASSFGKNLRLSVARAHRSAVHTVFTEVFGATHESPGPAFDRYVLADGFGIGVFWTETEPFDDAGWLRAPWLEFRVADGDAVRAALTRLGVAGVPHDDKAHTYHRIPGGPVFRLAA